MCAISHHPAKIRGLNLLVLRIFVYAISHHPAKIRGLNLLVLRIFVYAISHHPAKIRGTLSPCIEDLSVCNKSSSSKN